MKNFSEKIDIIKESILKNVPAKYIYLFGSYAYGKPTDESDVDIYTVIPDNIANTSEIYTKIMVDLSGHSVIPNAILRIPHKVS
jgi:predicted nucleotidyltransferase